MHSTPSQKFPQHCFWNGSNVHLIDDGPLSSFQGRSSSASSFSASLLQAISGVVSLALCLQVVSQASQHFRSEMVWWALEVVSLFILDLPMYLILHSKVIVIWSTGCGIWPVLYLITWDARYFWNFVCYTCAHTHRHTHTHTHTCNAKNLLC